MNATYGRLAALGRAELTLLGRNKNNLSIALVMPGAMVFLLKTSLDGVAPGELPIGTAAATVTGGTGVVLMLVVYMGLVAAYTARREELVLKRLRTGEVSDLEILAGGALPSVVLALLQIVVLSVGGMLALDLAAPGNPVLLLAGLLASVVLLVGAAALTTVFTRNAESASVTTLPFFMLCAVGSGMMLPAGVLPDPLDRICDLLPMSGPMALVRAGWTGVPDTGALLTGAAGALVWTVLTVFAVQRWFRWEPRR